MLHAPIGMGSAALAAAVPYPGNATRISRKGQWSSPKTKTKQQTNKTKKAGSQFSTQRSQQQTQRSQNGQQLPAVVAVLFWAAGDPLERLAHTPSIAKDVVNECLEFGTSLALRPQPWTKCSSWSTWTPQSCPCGTAGRAWRCRAVWSGTGACSPGPWSSPASPACPWRRSGYPGHGDSPPGSGGSGSGSPSSPPSRGPPRGGCAKACRPYCPSLPGGGRGRSWRHCCPPPTPAWTQRDRGEV